MSAWKWGALLVAALSGVLCAGLYSAFPEPSDELVTRRVAHRESRQDGALQRREARSGGRPEPVLAPAERASVRESTRTEQTDLLILAIEDHGLKAGWTDGEIAAVEDEVVAATVEISAELARVDRGEARWEEVRAPVRDLRLASAARVEALIGADRFRALADAVGLERFDGQAPVRGRLDGRRADASTSR